MLSPESGEFFPHFSSLLLTANKPTQKTGTPWEWLSAEALSTDRPGFKAQLYLPP